MTLSLRERVEALAREWEAKADGYDAMKPIAAASYVEAARMIASVALRDCSKALRAALDEGDATPRVHFFDQRAADTLAGAVKRLIERRVIDSRSEAADALLDYLDGWDRGALADPRVPAPSPPRAAPEAKPDATAPADAIRAAREEATARCERCNRPIERRWSFCPACGRKTPSDWENARITATGAPEAKPDAGLHTKHCASRLLWGDGQCECGANAKAAPADPSPTPTEDER